MEITENPDIYDRTPMPDGYHEYMRIGPEVYMCQHWMVGMPIPKDQAFVTIDTETVMLTKGKAPEAVCMQVCYRSTNVVHLIMWQDMQHYLEEMDAGSKDAIWTLHNGPFDFRVFGDIRLPHLKFVLDMIKKNRYVDTGIRFIFKMLQEGQFAGKWSLDYVCKKLLNIDIDKCAGKPESAHAKRVRLKAEKAGREAAALNKKDLLVDLYMSDEFEEKDNFVEDGSQFQEKSEDATLEEWDNTRLGFKRVNEDGTPWQMTKGHFRYACMDPAFTDQCGKMMPDSYKTEAVSLFGFIALDSISTNGMAIDQERRKLLFDEFTVRIDECSYLLDMCWGHRKGEAGVTGVEQKILQEVEDRNDWEFARSPKTNKIKTTDKSLSAMGKDHNFVKTMKKSKNAQKIVTTYLGDNDYDDDGNCKYNKIGVDGRVHPRFEPMVKTGRTSCRGPNLFGPI